MLGNKKTIWVKYENVLADVEENIRWYFDIEDNPEEHITKEMREKATNAPNFFKNTRFVKDSLFVIKQLRKSGNCKIKAYSSNNKNKQIREWLTGTMDFKFNEVSTKNPTEGDMMFSDSVEDFDGFSGICILFSAPNNTSLTCKDGYDYRCINWKMFRDLVVSSDSLTKYEERKHWYEKDNRMGL